jgi:RNA polymerase sigma-B factor
MSTALTSPHPGRRPAADGATTSDLVVLWQEHRDLAARARLLERFLPMARRLAARYRNPYEPQEDLHQVAALGLLTAIDRFDTTRAIPFEPYAIPTILGELKRHFRDTGWSVHVPRGAQELAQRVDRASREITSCTGRSPTVEEISRLLIIEVDEVLLGLEAASARFSVSSDVPASDHDSDTTGTFGDSFGRADGGYALVETKLSLQDAICRLPTKEHRALRLRMNRGLTQTEIAADLGCSQMQVSRLLRSAARHVGELTDPVLNGAEAA